MNKILTLVCLLATLAACSSLPTPPPAPQPTPSAAPSPVATAAPGELSSKIRAVAKASSCAKYDWRDRGQAHSGYIEGVALTYARTLCDKKLAAVIGRALDQSKTEAERDFKDAMSWWNSDFEKAGMGAAPMLRKDFTLLIGLGMRESSGEYCCGRDMNADFDSADSAEAGLFQTSWGASDALPEVLEPLFDKYRADQSGCLLDVFKQGISCSSANLKNWGSGDGAEWQKTTKACPRFAVEYGAVLLRVLGGHHGEFGPLGHYKNKYRKEAEVNPDCGKMLGQVEELVSASTCAAL